MTPTLAESPVGAIREVEFPHLRGGTFLNAASFGPLPLRSRRAAEELLRVHSEEPERFAAFDLMGALARCRVACARLVGADTAEIALGPSTSFGLYLAATLFPQHCERVGRRIDDVIVLVSDREFPANVLPWLGLRAHGARVEIVPTDERGFPDEEAVLARIALGDVGLFAVSAIQFASGYRADLERIGRACRDAGALFVVDGIQALGATPVDVRAAHIDVLACGGQKWLLAPHGSGFVYVRRELCALEPPLRGWLALERDASFNSLLDYDAPLYDDARRFEIGSPAPQDLVPLSESVELLLEVGIHNVAEHIETLSQPLRAWIDAHPRATLASPGTGTAVSAITCLALPDAPAAHARLTRAGVVCALREGVIRFSPHLYNTKDEMEGLIHTLEGIA